MTDLERICYSVTKSKLIALHVTLLALSSCLGDSIDPPTIYYQFCTSNVRVGSGGQENEPLACDPDTLVSNSTFKFGRTDQNVLDLAGKDVLRLKCNATYPIVWMARSEQPAIALNPYSTDESNRYDQDPLSNKTYTYSQQVHVQIRLLDSNHVLRCTTFSHINQAAEVFLKLAIGPPKGTVSKVLKSYLVDEYAIQRGRIEGTMTVPCVYKDSDGGNFTLHKLSRENLTHVMDYAPENVSYDHRIGFIIKEVPSMSFVFLCNSQVRHELVVPFTLSANFAGDIQYVNEEGSNPGIYCNPGNGTLIYQNYGTRLCTSTMECQFHWRPFTDVIFWKLRKAAEIRVEDLYNLISKTPHRVNGIAPDYNHGYIQCGGQVAKENGELYLFSKNDYWFTGLDSRRYLFSKHFPRTSIIHLSTSTPNTFTAHASHQFLCQISTFLLLPNIQFVVEYSFGKKPSKLLSLQQTLPPGAAILKLSPEVDKATLSWQLELTLTVDMTKVTCYAPWTNSSSWAQADIALDVKEAGVLSSEAVISICVAAALVILLTTLLVILWRKYKYALTRNLTKEEVKEFIDGTDSNQEGSDENVPVETRPFNRTMQISTQQLKIGNVILGEGEFGVVHQGLFQDQIVAVKSCKNTADVHYYKAFLTELKVLCYVASGEHKNIVRFFGAVVDRLEERKCVAVLEFSPHGNLSGFLRKHSAGRNGCAQNAKYENLFSANDNSPTLLNICQQIAEGMEYLSHKKVVHGDLATRNVLVFDSNLVKITDFGLSKKLYSCANYVKKKQGSVPWRWMAPESLRYLEFSTQSDTWSFGVTVWEIFTMAQVPYAGLAYNNEFVERLETGYRLTKPRRAPEAVHDLMMRCWQYDANDRPTFMDCIKFFASLEVPCAPLKSTETNYCNVSDSAL